MVFVGVYPAPLMDVVQSASDALLPPSGVVQVAGMLD
jgi:hypothetical protein